VDLARFLVEALSLEVVAVPDIRVQDRLGPKPALQVDPRSLQDISRDGTVEGADLQPNLVLLYTLIPNR
jgi:hypothetical protein